MKSSSQIIYLLSIGCLCVIIAFLTGYCILQPAQVGDLPITVSPVDSTDTLGEFASPSATAVHIEEGETTEPLLSVTQYRNPILGFAVEFPSSWKVANIPSCGSSCGILGQVQFTSNLSPGVERLDTRYQVTVLVEESLGKTLTETVELALSTSKRVVPGRTTYQCCSVVDGEPAAEVTILPGEIVTLASPTPPGTPLRDAGVYRVVILHDGWIYTMNFEPDPFGELSGSASREAFEIFLYSFIFIPTTASLILP